MRFCPFCSAENADELAVCQACGRRLPPLPPRRAGSRNAPPTGIQLPQRPAGSASPPPPPRPAPAPVSEAPAPRRAGNTLPPAIPTTSPLATGLARPPSQPSSFDATIEADSESTTVAPPPVDLSAFAAPVPTNDMTIPSAPAYQPPPPAAASRDSAPSLPPPPDPAAELRNAINPGPAAQRRVEPADPRIVADRRGRNEPSQSLSPAAFQRPPSQPAVKSTAIGIPSGPRPGSPSQPPPMRTPSPSQPPPMRAHSPSQPPPPPRAGSQPPPTRTTSPSQPPPMRAQRPSQAPPFSSPFPPAPPQPATSSPFAGDTFLTDNDTKAAPWEVVQAQMPRMAGEPPPTRIQRPGELADRPFTPPQVLPVPEIPEPGLVKAAKYAYIFARARWQRRGAIKQLGVEIKQDTEALDQVLGALGRAARGARVEGRVFSAENSAISDAEERINQLNREHAEVEGRKAEENSKFVDVERERNAKLTEAERMVDEAGRELSNLEGQRRSMRDKRKELERRQKAYLKAAEDHDRQAGTAPLGDQRQELRRVSEGHRREAAALEPERQDIDRRLGALERPINEVSARLDAGKAELDAAKRSLNDAREGHTHRLAELDAEQKRKTREVGLAESEIARRLVTLGTLVNLNRIEDPQFGELYQRIDRLRGAITARTTEIEKLTAEREAYDRGTLVRGISAIGGAAVLLIALIVILLAIL
jgi:hypothetical protein